MSTIYDVAKVAGVSAMTVSRSLNNPEKVSERTKEKIQTAMKQLGYKQNHAAKALVSKSTGIVKIVQADQYGLRDPYFTTLFGGISEVLSRRMLAQLVVDQLNPQLKSDGMIIMGLAENQKLDLDDFPEPVVIFGKGEDQTDWVDIDNFGGTYATTSHLIEIGHTKIAFIGFKADQPFPDERRQGYEQAMKDANLDIKPEWVVLGDGNETDAAKEVAIRALRQLDITAIACCTDIVAFGVIQAANELGLSVPQNLSVTGFDGIGLDQMIDPKLTTAKQPVFDIGQKLAEILLQRRDGKLDHQPPVHVLFPTELIVRDSTARLK